jgi:hypothetical protein
MHARQFFLFLFYLQIRSSPLSFGLRQCGEWDAGGGLSMPPRVREQLEPAFGRCCCCWLWMSSGCRPAMALPLMLIGWQWQWNGFGTARADTVCWPSTWRGPNTTVMPVLHRHCHSRRLMQTTLPSCCCCC